MADALAQRGRTHRGASQTELDACRRIDDSTPHAYLTDTRDRDRHLFAAAVLLACIDDPFAEREEFIGSDRARIAVLRRSLGEDHPAWRALPEDHRTQAQLALELFANA